MRAPHSRSMRTLALLAALAAPAAHPAAPDAPALARLAASLAGAEDYERADFARLALETLAADYDEEAARALARGAEGWARDAAAHAAQLRGLAGMAGDAADPGIEVDPLGVVNLTLDGRRVILVGPRLDDPQRFERALLAVWCAQRPCGLPLGDDREALVDDAHALAPGYQGQWNFELHGPTWVGPSGLRFGFADSSALRAKRDLAQALGEELLRLAVALREARAAGMPIDWEGWRLVAAPDPGPSRVELAAGGPALPLALPLLTGAPELWQAARGWLRAQAEGREQEVLLRPGWGAPGHG